MSFWKKKVTHSRCWLVSSRMQWKHTHFHFGCSRTDKILRISPRIIAFIPPDWKAAARPVLAKAQCLEFELGGFTIFFIFVFHLKLLS